VEQADDLGREFLGDAAYALSGMAAARSHMFDTFLRTFMP
jgi:hypothetical protein